MLDKCPWHYCNICKNICRDLICNACQNELKLITANNCPKCCKALFDNNGNCRECQYNNYFWNNFYCNLVYADPIKSLLHKLKYSKSHKQIVFLSYLLYHSLYKALDIKIDINGNLQANKHYDLIIPVPLHKSKYKERGFNQVEYLLLYYLYKSPFIINAPKIDISIIDRIKQTKAQATMHKNERLENLVNAFAIKKTVNSLNILLVDDVVTTGATINEVTKLLLENGANSVDICSLFRTV